MSLSARFAAAIKNGENIVVLTGAGISVESGVPTFRGADGLWNNHKPEELATNEAFIRDPKLVWEWYIWRRKTIANCKPNPAHASVTELENQIGDKFTLITQNVDGLHRAAGSQRYLEVHGCIWEIKCTVCGRRGEVRNIPEDNLPPKCTCGGLVRPNVVWYGEALPATVISRAFKAAAESALMVVIGTSGVVYPVAYLPQVARDNGAHIIEINPDSTPISLIANETYRSPAGDIMPRLVGNV